MNLINLVGLLMIFVGITLSALGGSLMGDKLGLGVGIAFFGVCISAAGGYMIVL